MVIEEAAPLGAGLPPLAPAMPQHLQRKVRAILKPGMRINANVPIETVDKSAVKHCVCVYPAYLEAGLTRAQGRRVEKAAAAGCAFGGLFFFCGSRLLHLSSPLGFTGRAPPSPLAAGTQINVQDLYDGALALGFLATAVTLEPAARYPRSDFRGAPGRLWVELKTPAGAAVHDTVATKEQLLKGLARVIPGMEQRRLRQEQFAQMHAQQMAQLEAMRKADAQRRGLVPRAEGGGGGGGGGKPKKGKK